VLVFDYRGYGESTGEPTAEGLKEDAVAVFDFLVSRGVDKKKIIPYGRSVGSGPAASLANRRDAPGLILVQPFTSTLAMGKKSFPYLPVRFILKEIFDNKDELSRMQKPLLIIHGDRDNIVPYSMGKELHNTAVSLEKTFVTLKRGDHNNIGATHPRQLCEAIRKFIERISPDEED